VKLFCQTFSKTTPTPSEKPLHLRSRSYFWKNRARPNTPLARPTQVPAVVRACMHTVHKVWQRFEGRPGLWPRNTTCVASIVWGNWTTEKSAPKTWAWRVGPSVRQFVISKIISYRQPPVMVFGRCRWYDILLRGKPRHCTALHAGGDSNSTNRIASVHDKSTWHWYIWYHRQSDGSNRVIAQLSRQSKFSTFHNKIRYTEQSNSRNQANLTLCVVSKVLLYFLEKVKKW